MKRHAMFVATALVVATLGTAGLAVAKGPGEARVQLDADGDGVVTRAEAAKHPRLAAKFADLDADGDGNLSAAERPRHHGKRGRHGQGRHGGGIERLDTDGDGRISRAEFDTKAADQGGKRTGGRLGSRFDFDAVDANKDGHIVRREVQAWHERQRPQRQAEMAKRFDAAFAEADLDRDGKLSRIEVDEKMPRMAKRFAWMDDNRDGTLSRSELAPKPRR